MFASPVPIHTVSSVRFTVSAPVDRDGWLSDRGVHFLPLLALAHTPPPAVAAYITFPSTARSVTRPPEMPKPAPALDQNGSVKPAGSLL